jgi:predicted nucleic-acid-binding protein
VIGLDTNCLVRYFVHDDASQLKVIRARLERGLRAGEVFYVNHVVLCELAWVLTSAYGFGKEDIETVLQAIVSAAQFDVEHKDVVLGAIGDFKSGKADFADCLIGRKNIAAGCDSTITFDKGTKTLSTYELLGAI